MRILLAASEIFPLIKTGGLADAVAGLASALAGEGHEVRIALPAYQGMLEQTTSLHRLGSVTADGHHYEIHEAHVMGLPPLWLFASKSLFERAGDPYHNLYGQPFSDNALRFGTFCKAVASVTAEGLEETAFRPELVHANDWHTGLILPWLQYLKSPVARVYTIHSLAYQGVFPAVDAEALGLPSGWWHSDGVEFHSQLSFMKAGIVYAHRITTVSPTYAREILTREYGEGLEGLLNARTDVLTGVVNGIDTKTWNPLADTYLVRRYGVEDCSSGKLENRRALQDEVGLVRDDHPLLIGCVTRLAYQKGIDLLAAAMTELMELPLQIVLVGAGDRSLGEELEKLSAQWHGRFAFFHGYNEALAHRVEAGADTFLMPSRYEPCGLNQMYSQNYGTPPIVRRTGGLADTVVDVTEDTLSAGLATGFHIQQPDVPSLLSGVRRALTLQQNSDLWQKLQRIGMLKDFSWSAALRGYMAVYRDALVAAENENRDFVVRANQG